MSTHDTRLDRLLPGLTAPERAILMLRDSKAGKPQDRQLLNSAPERQTKELNRLIGMMNAVNGDLTRLLTIIYERVLKEELRFGWLAYARTCALEMWAIRAHVGTSGKESITESEYGEREREARAEWLPVEECATTLTEEHHVFADADCEPDEDGERMATDAAWYRVRDEKVRELNTLVTAGTLVGKGKGKRLKIGCGSFYDWLGEPVLVVPDLGIAYDVRPDSDARSVARAREDHEFIRELLDRSACWLELPLDMESPLAADLPQNRFGVETARLLAAAIRAAVKEHWCELRAIEEQIDAITEEFDGEDVLHEHGRETLEEAKSVLVDLHQRLQEYTGPFELPEPDADVRAIVGRIVEKEVKHLPTR